MENEDGVENNLVDKLAQIETLLNEYEYKIHLKINTVEPNLGVTREYMEAMHWEDIQHLAFSYAQYSLFLQKELNKHQSRYNWSDANLKRFLEREAPNYEGWKWEERMSNALSDNVYAQKLHDLKVRSKMAIDRLAFLPSKIEFLSKLAIDIMKAKRYKHVEGE
jgi:hypothetical protein